MSKRLPTRIAWFAILGCLYAYGFYSLPEGGPGLPLAERVALMLPWLGQAWPALALITTTSGAAAWLGATIYAERRARVIGGEGDMPMRELFHFLRFRSQWTGKFDGIESWTRATWQSVEDRLGSGELRCWGRNSIERVGATDSPPRPLDDTTIWTGARLDMMSVMSDRFEEFAQTHPIQKGGVKIVYYDLRVNRLQVYQYWKPRYGLARWLYRWRMVDRVFDGETKVWVVRSFVREARYQGVRRAQRAWKHARLLGKLAKRKVRRIRSWKWMETK